MKSKIPFSTLLIAIGMKLASFILSKVADAVGSLKILKGVSSILGLCSTICNIGFWALIVFFVFRLALLVFSKIRKNKAALKLQMTEEKAQAAMDKATIEAAKQEVIEATDYTGRQAKGF